MDAPPLTYEGTAWARMLELRLALGIKERRLPTCGHSPHVAITAWDETIGRCADCVEWPESRDQCDRCGAIGSTGICKRQAAIDEHLTGSQSVTVAYALCGRCLDLENVRVR